MPAASRRCLFALASAATFVAVACNQDRLTAPKTDLRPATLLPLGASSHPKNSPDLIVGQFKARNASNAKTSTDSTFGFRVKWYTTYKVTVYDWADQVANGFPIDEKHPIALSGGVYWSSGINARSRSFSDTAAGPVSMYIDFAVNDTVHRVSTNGAGAVSMSGTYEDGTPFWCGPAYPGTPACYRYEGAPGSVTFERLNAEAELTADSSSAGYNSTVTFSLKSVPAFVDGEEMALTIDKTSWTPDADTLGGDPTDVATSGACTWTGPVSSKTCTRQNKSSGTLKVVGGVNGKYFEKTWHISRTDAYPIVTPSKYYVDAGQIDTFKVRMSDGSTFKMSRWDWFADSGVKQTVVGCAVYTNPCNNTAVMESGRIRARVVHNNVYKYSQAHVTVGPRPRLQLDADKSSIILDDTVSFTTSAGDAPYSITSWTFHKAAASSCGTSKTCDYKPRHSGRMWVFGVVDGDPDTAFVDISVRLNDDGTGLSGVSVDSAVLDSAGASKLTVIATDGLDVTPTEGVHLFPVDSVVPYSFVVQSGYIDSVVVRDDTGTATVGAVSMSRDHVLEGATRPNYLLNADVAYFKNRYRQMLVAADKKLAYAGLLTSYSGMAARTSQAYADWVFLVADRLAFEPSRGDSAALRILDETLGGTTFFTTRCGDSVVFHPETYGSCGLIALRGADRVARLAADSLHSLVVYVNGIRNNESEAELTFAAFLPIVNSLPFRDSVEARLFYNPTFQEQKKQWDSRDKACWYAARRLRAIMEPIMALYQAADCLERILVRSIFERDEVEMVSDMAATLYGVSFGIPSEVAEDLADSIPTLIGGGRSLVFVAHSQGNLIVNRALQLVTTPQPLNAPPSRCVALLSLASPLHPDNFVLDSAYRRHLTVKHDILRQFFMDHPADELETPLSREFDEMLPRLQQEELTQGPGWVEDHRRQWGVKVHNATENYFKPPASIDAVRQRLTELRSRCVSVQ
jgi:hypothetical protein